MKIRTFLPTAACFALILCVCSMPAAAQTGKITGIVTDARTGDPLPGANVVITGTLQGTTADADGFYFIHNLRPGTYELQTSFVGYLAQTTRNVRVSTGLTETVDIALQEQTVDLDLLVVSTERPIVQPDVSANVANLDPATFESLPIAGVEEVLDLQAGIEPGLRVRGGAIGETAFILDGMSLRTGRANTPFTNISYTSLEEVQVQTGGFNAEYGNVRSGLVNVATREAPRDRYTVDALFRLAPPQAKAFEGLEQLGDCDYSAGPVSPNCDLPWIRPRLDPAVNRVGTANGSWSPYTRRQYNLFDGWNREVESLSEQGFDVTVEDLIALFRYQQRKDNTIDIPDYEADITLGGPLVPGLSSRLGDLRFLFSYRGTQTAYLYPQSRAGFDTDTYQLKLTSNIGRGMKLSVQGLRTLERGINSARFLAQVRPWRGNLPTYPWQDLVPVGNLLTQRGGFGETFSPLFAMEGIGTNASLNRTDVDHNLIGVQFTHALSPRTFYQTQIHHMASRYRSPLPPFRDSSFEDENGVFHPVLWTDRFGTPTETGGLGNVTCFGGSRGGRPYCVGMAPFGFGDLEDRFATTRDTSDVRVWTLRFDLTSQINPVLELKTGAELIATDYDMHFSEVNLAVGTDPLREHFLQNDPIQGAAYVQTKMEFKGLIANLGVRLDYLDPNVDWWVFDPYDQVLSRRIDQLDAALEKEAREAHTFLSPRLGVSFPISADSKIYFNYGHFRQMPDPFLLYGIEQSSTGGIHALGTPEHPMPQTVSYELGFDRNLFSRMLLRISGFYRDVRNQPRRVTFQSLGNVVSYNAFHPWNYEDIRGLEFTLAKNRGQWLRGFVNYTYLQRKEGNFGVSNFYQNQVRMLDYLSTSTDFELDVPLAEPFARMNLMLLTPLDWGPAWGSIRPLADWRLSLLGEWRSGQKWIWSGRRDPVPPEQQEVLPGLRENVQWRDYWNLDLRLSKSFDTGFGSLDLFVDVSNVLNLRRLYSMSVFGFNVDDLNDYMWSLHLPADLFEKLPESQRAPYLWVPGDDQPGDYREPDVAFQPIEAVSSLDAWNTADDRTPYAWIWAQDTGRYSRWTGDAWELVPEAELQEVLDEKGYIDMPNARFATFLNPRRFTLGLRYRF